MTYITAPGEPQCFLLRGRMEHATLRDPGPLFLDKLGDPRAKQWTCKMHMNFSDGLLAFLGKSPILCISESIMGDQERLHQCVNSPVSL